MTNEEILQLLENAVKEFGSQAKVGKLLGYSTTTISQALSGKYPGSIEIFLGRVEEVFGTRPVTCPILGDIPLNRCVRERRRPFSTANPMRVQLYRACGRCEHNDENPYRGEDR